MIYIIPELKIYLICRVDISYLNTAKLRKSNNDPFYERFSKITWRDHDTWRRSRDFHHEKHWLSTSGRDLTSSSDWWVFPESAEHEFLLLLLVTGWSDCGLIGFEGSVDCAGGEVWGRSGRGFLAGSSLCVSLSRFRCSPRSGRTMSLVPAITVVRLVLVDLG